MKYLNCIILSCFVVLCIACSVNEAQLAGQWRACALYENGQTKPVTLEQIRLQINPNGRYQFNTIGHYSEAGTWRTSMKYLFMLDTVHQPITEHAAKVQYLSQDTLKLIMQTNGTEMVLFMSRDTIR
jgi:hypothetical protein